MNNNGSKIKWELIATLVISVSSVFVAIKANTISNIQAEIARNTALPVIEVTERVEDAEGFEWDKHSVIEIKNLSGKMNNYQSEVISFLHSGYFNKTSQSYETVDVPMMGYYFFGIKERTTSGVVEKKYTADNFSRFLDLRQSAQLYNDEKDSIVDLNIQIVTYLRIRYLDLLSQEQEEYYLVNSTVASLIDSAEGREVFSKYNNFLASGLYINPNRAEDFTAEKTIAKIKEVQNYDVTGFQRSTKQESGRYKMASWFSVIATIVGAIIGAVATLLGVGLTQKHEYMRREKYSATILLNDLASIERYLSHERSSVNIRYSDTWQRSVASCHFLTDDDVKWIYDFYDEAYNYNYIYKAKEHQGIPFKKEDIASYGKMQRAMFDVLKGYPDFTKHSEKYEALIIRLNNVSM